MEKQQCPQSSGPVSDFEDLRVQETPHLSIFWPLASFKPNTSVISDSLAHHLAHSKPTERPWSKQIHKVEISEHTFYTRTYR